MSSSNRTIGATLVLENESQFRAALKNSAAELRSLKSELDLVSSEYRTNANSMDALTAKGNVLAQMYGVQSQRIATLKAAVEKSTETRDAEQKTVTELRAQYEQAKKALESYGEEVDKSSEEYQKAKTEVDNLRDAVIKHQAKLDSATGSVNKYEVQLNRAEIELNNLKDQQTENNHLLNEAKQSADGCATSIDRYGDAVRDAADGTEKSVSAVEALSSAMIASGIKQKVDDLAASMMECSEAAAAYELSLAKVGTLADTAVLSQQEIRSGILELSSDLGKSADEIAEASYQALSAGVDTANMLDFTRQATQLSVAGFTDAATSVDVLTTVLNAYGLEASQAEAVASKLVKTQDLGKITVDDLGKVMGRVIPSAAAYGVNLDNVAAAYARMTASGINAENSTTYLSTMLDELADSGSSVAGVLQEQTGKSFAQLMSSGASLGDVLDIIGKSVKNDSVQFSNLWSSSTAGKAALALFNSGAEAFNATLVEMENSSGSVAANYAKMADTSDYASRRLSVASQNLKIAVGDQLNPVLDSLRTAGAGILEAASNVVSQNPALVSAITGVVTALGLLATGLSGLMIIKSVTAAMTALNIAMTANPAVLVAVGIAGLTAAIATFVSQTEDANARLAEMTEYSRTLAETVESGNQSYDDAVVSAEAAANMVDTYIDRLEDLESQGLATDAQQMEYQMTLDKINEIMPGLNAEIDAQTELVKGGTAALRSQADAWKQAAVQEAAYARYRDDIAAMTNAEYELAKNQSMLNMAEKDAKGIKQELERNTEALNDAYARQQELQESNIWGTEEYRNAMIEVNEEISRLTEEETQLNAALFENEQNRDILQAAIDQNTTAIEENKIQVDAATAAFNGLTTAQEENTEYTNEATSATEEYAQKLMDVREALSGYEEAFAAAGIDIDGFTQYIVDSGLTADEAASKIEDYRDRIINATDEVEQKSQADMDSLISNMQQRTETYKSWNDSIAQLQVQYGDQLSSDFISYVRDLGPEYNSVLEEWLSGSSDQMLALQQALEDGTATAVESFSAEYGVLPQTVTDISEDLDTASADAGKKVTDTMQTSAADTVNRFKSEFKQLPGDMQAIGEQVVNGMIQGLNNRSSALYSTVRRIVNTSISQARSAADTHSPSKKTEKIYTDVGEGMIVGLEKKREKINSTSRSVVQDSIEQMHSASKQYKQQAEIKTPIARYSVDIPALQPKPDISVDSAYREMIRTRNAALTSVSAAAVTVPNMAGNSQEMRMLQSILDAIKAGQVLVLDSNAFVGATAGQYDAALGQKQILSARGAV